MGVKKNLEKRQIAALDASNNRRRISPRDSIDRQDKANFLKRLPKPVRNAIHLTNKHATTTDKNLSGAVGSMVKSQSIINSFKYKYGGKALQRKFNKAQQDLIMSAEKLRAILKPVKIKRDASQQIAPAPKPAAAPVAAKVDFTPKTVQVFDTYQQGSGEMKRGYVAKITGTHPKYKLDRQFLNGPTVQDMKTVTIKERGIYEMQSMDFKKQGATERTYELHGRNKVRTIHESLDPRKYHIPIKDNKSVERIARLLTIFSKKK